MKTKIPIILLFTLIIPFNNLYATGYDYLPADVLIKQRQEKEALEYRIKSLETQMSGSPELQIMTIDSRIRELEKEKEIEKEYLKGLLAGSGAISSFDSRAADIDAKYNDLINDLERQKGYYQDQIDEQEDIDREIEEVKKQIKEIDAYYDNQIEEIDKYYDQKKEELNQNNNSDYVDTDNSSILEIFNILDSQEYLTPEIKELNERMKNEAPDLYNEVYKLADQKYFNGKKDPVAMFNYMDTLSKDQTSLIYNKLKIFNPSLNDKVADLVREKYPDGKEDYQYTGYEPPVEKQVKYSSPQKKETINLDIEDKNEKEEITSNEESSEDLREKIKLEVREEIKKEIEAEEETESKSKGFMSTVGGFFKKLLFWK